MVESNFFLYFRVEAHSTLFQSTISEQFADQVVLIDALAPYFRHLKRSDKRIFFARLFDMWFIRWRLKLQDHGGNMRLVKAAKVRQMKVRSLHYPQATINQCFC